VGNAEFEEREYERPLYHEIGSVQNRLLNRPGIVRGSTVPSGWGHGKTKLTLAGCLRSCHGNGLLTHTAISTY